MISKSYRAALPILPEEAERLRRWSEAHCAATNIVRENTPRVAADLPGECYIWSATRERGRTREAFMRSIRATLQRLAIDTSRLRGCWLQLGSNDSGDSSMRSRATTHSQQITLAPSSAAPDDSDERVVVLSNPQGNRKVSALQVYKI